MGASSRTRGKTRTWGVVTILTALSLVAGLSAPSSAYQRPGTTELVSVSSKGVQQEQPLVSLTGVGESSISADGRYIAFISDASNLVPGDTNAMADVFVRDRKAGTTRRVSISTEGIQAVGGSSNSPSISDNGRFVLFSSAAPNLVIPDTNGIVQDAFVHDLKEGTTELASLRSTNDQSLSHSWATDISATGRYVVFETRGPDPAAGDNNNNDDLYLRDRITKKTQLVSVGTDGQAADGGAEAALGLGSIGGSVSANGRFVAFSSHASDLVEGDTNLAQDCFVRNMETENTRRVSIASDGSEGRDLNRHGCSDVVALSGDGHTVAFSSYMNNLVPSDRNGDTSGSLFGVGSDVFVHDLRTSRTERVSVLSAGQESPDYSIEAELSENGRFVTFLHDTKSFRDHALGDPFDFQVEVVLYDRMTGSRETASLTTEGRTFTCPGLCPQHSLSASGRYISFKGFQDDASGGDSNGMWDVFVRDRGTDLGVGGLGGASSNQPPPDERICVTDVCIPPGAVISSSDTIDDLNGVLTGRGANLYGAWLAYRPQYSDLFVKIELEHMPKVLPAISPIFYGLGFKVEGKNYEVRATSFNFGTFGLFDCTGPACTKVVDLQGGYGTTGMRVVFSVPLDEIGLQDGGELENVEAFTGLGTFETGAMRILDRVQLE